MSAKAIREYDAKLLVSHFLTRSPPLPGQSNYESQNTLPEHFVAPVSKVCQIRHDPETNQLGGTDCETWGWVKEVGLVAKPDQLIKRRGKAGLLKIDANWDEACDWIAERAGKPVKVESTVGTLNTFIVEPFLPHPPQTEYYICINSVREGDVILFTHEGGIDVGDVDAKAMRLVINVDESFPSSDILRKTLLAHVPEDNHAALGEFIERLYAVYVDLHYTYLEINPLVVLDPAQKGGKPSVHYLDMAAKLDQTAEFEVGHKWAIARALSTVRGIAPANKALADMGPPMEFPAPFGRDMTKEEAHIADLDAKTGASLKLTVLNAEGRVWTMVAGGGASVVYSDAIAAHGFAHEMANYGEYSGAPSQEQTYQYARTILDLMTRGAPKQGGKVLIIGGGIANFTNVASTFKGIIRALKEYKQGLIAHDARIYVRRGGPNYQEGLRAMRLLGENLGVSIEVSGPEDFITQVVPLALSSFGAASRPRINSTDARQAQAPAVTDGLVFNHEGLPEGTQTNGTPMTNGNSSHGSGPADPPVQSRDINANIVHFQSTKNASVVERPWFSPFDAETRSFVYGLQPRAVQLMLDFDFVCGRKTPSVAAVIYPFGGHHLQKLYWGTKETLLPVYTSLTEAVSKHPEADTVVNFASSRSVYAAMQEIFQWPQIRSVAIIAEGVPERRARQILWQAKKQSVLIIGPATVGGIKPGCFRIGNTGGMMDNVIASKLYRPGSVAYVSKSGGMSNELNSIISLTTDGVYEGVAIGGDRYPGSTFIDHLLRYEADPNTKLLVLLGEVGGIEEYRVIEAVQSGQIKKPVVAWAIGTCAKMFSTEVQFGHAGSMANSDLETAEAKNSAMRAAGIIVPRTFEDLPTVLSAVYEKLVKSGAIQPKPEPEIPKVPMDYNWAQELGLIRKPAAFISTISDERGQELLYAGMPISEVFKENIGIGGVVSLLWFKRRLPDYACKFLEMVLMMTADHGPAVSGAHNAIVTARAGKDLISSLVSGLVTIGPRFGGALDGAATEFSKAYDAGQTPREFVDTMRRANKLIPGIGHKVKSRQNPDMRVELVKTFVKSQFPSTDLVDYAIAVEDVTTSKKDTLILNVDGIVATAFVDLLRGSGAFSREEVTEYLEIGVLNGLFVLGRSIGFIGHYLDQKRLKQPLYRHPYDDIFLQMSVPTRTLT